MAVQPNVDNKKDCFLFLQGREFLANCHISGQQTTHRTQLALFFFLFLQPVAHLKPSSCFHIILVSFLPVRTWTTVIIKYFLQINISCMSTETPVWSVIIQFVAV